MATTPLTPNKEENFMFVCYDLETTGLSTTSDDVVQFSYIRFNSNNQPVQAETLYFYYEGMHWSAEAEAIHHLTLDFVKQFADQFEANVVKMYSILSLSNVVGFNSNNFDNVFARNWLARMGMSNLVLGIQKDIMALARPVVHQSRISLTKLCDRLGLTPEIIRQFESLCYGNEGTQSHIASYDVAATALCALKFMREGYLTWKFGKTDVKSDDVFGNNVTGSFDATEDDELPEDPLGFWVKVGETYTWLSRDFNKYEGHDPVTEMPIQGRILIPDHVEKGEGLTVVYDFVWCKLFIGNESKLHIAFDYGEYFAANIPFESLLEKLKEESDKRV